MLNYIKLSFLVGLLLITTACSTISTDELSDEINKKVDEEVGKVVNKVKEEGKKKTEDVVAAGKESIDNVLNDFLGSEQTNDDSPKEPIETTGTTEQIPFKVTKYTDGDTIRGIYSPNNDSNGQEISLRYLLLDSPETSHPQLGIQPFGEEASKRNEELLKSGQVTIEFDVGERVDKYSRLLAYVYVDGVSVNETLIREGLARVAYVYPPNTRHLSAYEKAQEKAKKDGIGIWSIENYVTNKGFVE